MTKILSVVIPAFNEEKSLPLLQQQLIPVLDSTGMEWEVIVVDDGSIDNTLAILQDWSSADPRFRYAALSRNFGHEAATSCGLKMARGDAVVIMDADLQDPPALIPAMLWK